MSLIEQAAKRLEQLREAGIEFVSDVRHPAAGNEVPVEPEKSPSPAARAKDAPQQPTAISRAVDIDLEALAAANFASPTAPRSRIADEFRVIKRPLIANAMGKGAAPIPYGNLIMVTSSLPGEGKTFTAINLAMSIAMEFDNTVMLVDADVARPSVLNTLGLPPSPGLMDLLKNNSVDLSGVLLRTNIEKLTLLPSGMPHPRATELLASDAMNALLVDISERYSDRIIIFDSPPLLLTTESRVLATHMGQIVMVVKAETTAQGDVKNAISMIEQCPVKMLLLNQTRNEGRDTGYGYGYGYGYGDAA